jgi:hypothetical protein
MGGSGGVVFGSWRILIPILILILVVILILILILVLLVPIVILILIVIAIVILIISISVVVRAVFVVVSRFGVSCQCFGGGFLSPTLLISSTVATSSVSSSSLSEVPFLPPFPCQQLGSCRPRCCFPVRSQLSMFWRYFFGLLLHLYHRLFQRHQYIILRCRC